MEKIYQLEMRVTNSIHPIGWDNSEYIGTAYTEDGKKLIKQSEFISLYSFNNGYYYDSSKEGLQKALQEAKKARERRHMKDKRLDSAITLANTYSFNEHQSGTPGYDANLILGFVPKLVDPLEVKNREVQEAISELLTEKKAQTESLQKLLDEK